MTIKSFIAVCHVFSCYTWKVCEIVPWKNRTQSGDSLENYLPWTIVKYVSLVCYTVCLCMLFHNFLNLFNFRFLSTSHFLTKSDRILNLSVMKKVSAFSVFKSKKVCRLSLHCHYCFFPKLFHRYTEVKGLSDTLFDPWLNQFL